MPSTNVLHFSHEVLFNKRKKGFGNLRAKSENENEK